MSACEASIELDPQSCSEKMAKESGTKEPNSTDLLECGNGIGFPEKLLLKSRGPSGASSLQTVRVPRSNVLDRLQSFLPRLAQANESLQQQMDAAPDGRFDIESVEGAEKVIEMDVALVELEDSDSEEESSSSSSEDSSEEEEQTVTLESLRLPGDRKRKANIQVLERDGKGE